MQESKSLQEVFKCRWKRQRFFVKQSCLFIYTRRSPKASQRPNLFSNGRGGRKDVNPSPTNQCPNRHRPGDVTVFLSPGDVYRRLLPTLRRNPTLRLSRIVHPEDALVFLAPGDGRFNSFAVCFFDQQRQIYWFGSLSIGFSTMQTSRSEEAVAETKCA